MTISINLAVLSLLAAGTYASLYLTLRNDSQWSAIAHRNLYDVTPSRFIEYRHPDSNALDEMLTSIRSTFKPPNSERESMASGSPVKAARAIRHVLIIAIEGWNSSYVGPETMPFFTALQKEGIRFTDHYSSGNNTLLGILGLVYGQSPAFFFEKVAEDSTHSPYALRLNANGYALKRFGSGLNSYRNIEGYIKEFQLGSEASNIQDVLSDIRQHIQTNHKTVSLFYYPDTHFPYNHSEEFSKFQPETPPDYNLAAGVKPKEIPKLLNRYKNTLLEADDRLRTVFKDMDWRDMLIAITGDHGEAMMENGRLSHSSSLERPQVTTPLFLYYPGIFPGVFSQTSSHLDIMQTIFDVLGLEYVKDTHGLSLVRKHGSRQALVAHNNQNYRPTRVGVVNGSSKLIMDFSSLRNIKVVDLMSPDDSFIRLSNVKQDELTDSMGYVTNILYLSGCSVVSQSSAQMASGSPGSRTALRHCKQ
jgi:hypothetical protein